MEGLTLKAQTLYSQPNTTRTIVNIKINIPIILERKKLFCEGAALDTIPNIQIEPHMCVSM